ncbi:hypothetical protein [Pedococcus sp. 5OH_020]|uniref:hypothetical protein n=1 Tax=Pedococcus sp. 5OH_020 TaxID=2989814 RepID=UPI0022E9C2EB|nr:hypothetical protein [Pedococcus sp. 5OH_020]
MPYVISGRLVGLLCDDCSEPLVGATVRLVTSSGDRISHAAAAEPKQTTAVLEESVAAERASSVLGEGVVDANGGFTVELEKGYDGGAFDVDIFCGTMTGHRVPPKPLSFTLTTLAPQWRETEGGYAAAWSYDIPHRIWCGIRGRLGWWSICGDVRVCDTTVGVPGVKVSAFDVDWLQDDALGSAVTDATGHFRIDYTVADFSKTPWSPWINIELVPGPDVYFRVDGPTGVLLQESRSRGRSPDRQNVGPCFCVDLCVADAPGGTDQPYPWFDHIGVYKTVTGFDSASGGTGRTIADNRAFYASLRLNGVLGRLLNGQPAEYRFEYDDGSGWKPVLPAQMVAMQIGTWERLTGTLPPVETKAVVVLGANGPDEIAVTPDAQGWIAVPQDNSLTTGLFVPDNNLLGLNSETLSAQTHDLAGVVAGQSTAPAGLAIDEYVAVRMVMREVGQPVTQVQAGIAERVALANTTYNHVQKHGSWVPTRVNGQLAPVSIDVEELIGHGCARIQNTLTVDYTAAHPNLSSMSLTVSGPGGPYHYALPAIAADYHGSVNQLLDAANNPVAVSSLPKCSYILQASIGLLLTTGDSSPLPIYDDIAFTTQ